MRLLRSTQPRGPRLHHAECYFVCLLGEKGRIEGDSRSSKYKNVARIVMMLLLLTSLGRTALPNVLSFKINQSRCLILSVDCWH